MAKLLYPDDFKTSVYELDPGYFEEKGIKNIIVDIDNTLSKWGSKEPQREVCQWLQKLREDGMNICILSNSSNKRIRKYCSNLDVFFAENVRKPFKASFNKAMRLMESSKYDTCVIGDQIFTDILGGNLSGLYTILVTPVDKKELFFTRITRKIEKLVVQKHLEK
jgi:HAD superfamily phosphatase (TIGR01668 family)